MSDLDLDLDDIDFDDVDDFVEVITQGVDAYVESHSGNLPDIDDAILKDLVRQFIGDSDGDDDIDFDDVDGFVATLNGTILDDWPTP